MTRGAIARLALACIGILTAGTAALAWAFGDAWIETGQRRLRHRPPMVAPLARPHPERPLAIFLGDSTFMPGFAYPRLLARRLSGRAQIAFYWWEGFEPFHHYLVAGRVLEAEPRAVVIVAQPRVFWRHEPLWYEDLLTLVPLRELPRAVLLPFHERGVSVPRLALASLLGTLRGTADTWIYAFSGARDLAGRVPLLRWIVPRQTPSSDPRTLVRLREERFRAYALPIYAGHPAVRALAASVEQAERRGARTLVLVSPIPVERLAGAGLYDRETFARRVDVIRRAVEDEGGELVDLHALLSEEDFSDEFGHMRELGALRMADALLPWLEEALELGGPGPPARERRGAP